MGLKELYHSGMGYEPLVMTRDWQVAQLNYAPEQEPDALTMLDQHDFTDETFTLLEGRALLITYDTEEKNAELTPLKPGITYNVPVRVWHNIAMEKWSKVIITEGRDAHVKGCVQISMPEEVREEVISYTKAHWRSLAEAIGNRD